MTPIYSILAKQLQAQVRNWLIEQYLQFRVNKQKKIVKKHVTV